MTGKADLQVGVGLGGLGENRESGRHCSGFLA